MSFHPMGSAARLQRGVLRVLVLRFMLSSMALAAPSRAETAEGTCSAGVCRDVDRGHLEMPRVIVGCWQLLERYADREEAVRTLTSYAHANFTAFDTADIYGPSESILGDFRRRWVAANPTAPRLLFYTKYVTDDASSAAASRVNAQSLRNLGVPSVDLVQFHWWSLSKDGSQREFLQAGRELSRLQREGKIRSLAGCNMDTTNLNAMLEAGMAVEANQVQYSLLDRRPEVRLLKYCKEKGIRLAVYGVVGGGLLSDRFLGLSRGAAQGKLDSVSRRMYWASLQRWSADWELFQRLLRTLRAIGQRQAPPASVAAVACAWALQRLGDLGAGGSLILGVRDARHLDEHRALLEGAVQLQPPDLAEIQEVLDAGNPPQGDVWYQERGWA